MYLNNHAPPHFHAEYGELRQFIRIETLDILRGHLPSVLIAWWWSGHWIIALILRANGTEPREQVPLNEIKPLDSRR